ncbi:MAG TPA: M14 family zinc carboxypeptidase, partial [Holophagaceae bacterium]|nr:M14 family zinc carboxypeptidase [Holophagaceae bacterium]
MIRAALPVLPLLALSLAAAAPWPKTVPEHTGFAATSTVAEVRAFMDALRARAPRLVPYQPKGAPAATEAGKPLLAWRLPSKAKDALRVYLNANIHGGEVEGEEAVQELLRELLQGQHPELRDLDLVICPAYNADGTDALDPANRRHQPNPASGVGRREDARGLDLNRDLMKAQAANTRWFLAMLDQYDPAAVLDLHTTDGSTHGFRLTYAPSLVVGGDAGVGALNRRLLAEVRGTLDAAGLPTYDYGNFGPKEHDPAPTEWTTFEAFPRYLSNYPGLRNRLGILSEAYVYDSYPQRVADTKAFVLACLRWLAAHKDEVKAAEAAADAAWRKTRPELPLRAEMVKTEDHRFTIVDPVWDADRKLVGEKGRKEVTLPSLVSFEGRDLVTLPAGYLVDPAYAFKVRPVLEAHGIRVLPGSRRPKAPLGYFIETARHLETQAFQGAFSLDLEGRWSLQPP